MLLDIEFSEASRSALAQAERMFGYYLSAEVIQQLREDPSKLKRSGETVEITAFFTDLAGFSTVSERLAPEVPDPHVGDGRGIQDASDHRQPNIVGPADFSRNS